MNRNCGNESFRFFSVPFLERLIGREMAEGALRKGVVIVGPTSPREMQARIAPRSVLALFWKGGNTPSLPTALKRTDGKTVGHLYVQQQKPSHPMASLSDFEFCVALMINNIYICVNFKACPFVVY